jgi:hypothetical protein
MMTRDTNDELLLIMLFFGLRFFEGSFAAIGARAALPSPKGGAVTFAFEGKTVLFRGPRLTSDSLTPDVGGAGFVASGFGLMIGASDGCGGGVARCRSS